ncbi:MAG: hypothetical protein WBA74_14125, partial [Cyclobacteriaceae bacterium]
MKLLQTLLLLFFTTSLLAQNYRNGGKIRYRETIQMKYDFQSDDPRMDGLKDVIPEKRESEKLLLFKDAKSLYKNVPAKEEAESQIVQEDNMKFSFTFNTPENIYFRNFSTGETIQQKSFMGRTFLV